MTNPTYSKFNQLLEDPSFVLGASILGNTGQPGVVGSAMQNMANINNMKRQRDLQAQQLEQAKAAQQATAAYQQGSLQNETERTGMERERTAAQSENYKSEAALRQAQMQQEMRKQAMQENFFKALAPQFGIDPAAFMQQQGGEATPQGAPQPQENGPVPGTTMGPTPPASMPGGMRPRQLVPLVPMLPGHGHIEPLQPAQDTPFQGMTSKYMQRTNGSDMAPYILNQESGNRSNVGQSIDGAVGPGQMLPATFQRFARPGESISNPNDNRAVSARYLDYLAAKAAGDPAKVAAGYFSGEGNMGTGSQPFKRDVADGNGKRVSSYVNDIMAKMGGTTPTGYTARVLAGADQPPAKQSGVQSQPMANNGLKMAGLGALGGMMGIPGAAGLVQYGGMLKPETVPAGSYQRDPQTGETTFVGDPYREQSLANDQQRIGMDQQRLGLEGDRVKNDTRKTDVEVGRIAAEQHQQELKLTKEQSNDTLAYRTIQDKMGNLGKTVDEIMKSPGLGSNAGWKGALHVGDIPGTEGHDTQVKLENLKSRVTIEVMSALKQASATGSTGFGQLSEKEGETLRNYLSNLDKAQTERSLKEALGNIKDFSAKSAGNYKEFYKNTYGKLPDAEQQQSAPAAAPAGLPTGWKRIQ